MSALSRRAWSHALLVATALFLPVSIRAQASAPARCPGARVPDPSSPFIGVLIDGACTNLSSSIQQLDTRERMWRAQVDQTIGGSRIQLDVTFKYDPFITFGVTTTNFTTGPVTYAFLFGTPVLPAQYNAASSSAGLSVTRGQDPASVTSPGTYPSFVSGTGTAGVVGTNLGVDIGSGSCTATTMMPTQVCPYGPAANAFAPTFFNGLEALLTYRQAGAQSVASWSGRVDLLNTPQSTVPEPATVLLVGIGLAATGLVARRRRGER